MLLRGRLQKKSSGTEGWRSLRDKCRPLCASTLVYLKFSSSSSLSRLRMYLLTCPSPRIARLAVTYKSIQTMLVVSIYLCRSSSLSLLLFSGVLSSAPYLPVCISPALSVSICFFRLCVSLRRLLDVAHRAVPEVLLATGKERELPRPPTPRSCCLSLPLSVCQ